MKAKMELIQQIRAMEAKPVIRHKLVDLTKTAGYGLLSEMSIAEVKWIYFRIDIRYYFHKNKIYNKNMEIISSLLHRASEAHVMTLFSRSF